VPLTSPLAAHSGKRCQLLNGVNNHLSEFLRSLRTILLDVPDSGPL